MGATAIVVGATLIGFDPNRESVTLTLPGRHSVQVNDAVLIVSGSHYIHAGDVLGAMLLVAGIAVLWRGSFWRGMTGVIPIIAGTLLIDTGTEHHDPVLLTLPRGGHGLHATDVLGMAIVLVGVTALWQAPPVGAHEPRSHAEPPTRM